MKSALLILLACCLSLITQAQSARDFLTFQGVARLPDGKAAANQNISLRFGIHPLLSSNVYQEEHHTVANEQGVFTVLIGAGTVISGNFSNIKWESGYYFLNTEMDLNGGNNYVSLGSTQLVSVPYALHSKQSDRWKNDEPIIQSGQENAGSILPFVGDGPRLVWYPRKYAFMTGFCDGNTWRDDNIGLGSSAFGLSSVAKGNYSTAFGIYTTASGQASLSGGDRSIASANSATALGSETKAQAAYATSLGRETTAKGVASTAIGIQSIAHAVGSLASGYLTSAEGNMSLSAGEGTFAKAFASATFGAYNNVQDNPSGPAITDAKGSDRLFQIGNGSGPAALSNAFTVLRNGRIGIGNGSIVPHFILDIDGRPRIRHAAETAGIYFDNSAHEPKSFVGMKTDEQIGFYLGNDWRFWVNATGGATLVGALQEVSDVRLKRDFSPLQNSLTKLSQLSGYHYFWKNKNLSQTTQTGLIAQEVEKLFPELVKTDEKGFKTVNYTGLIPHLIEALKELDTKNKELDNALSRLNHLEASVNELLKKEKIDTHDQKEVR